MDIFLRNIDRVAMQKVDALAKENGMSRQQFLKEQFEILAFFDEQVEREKKIRSNRSSEHRNDETMCDIN